MKKLLIIGLALLFTGCITTQQVKPQDEYYSVFGYDFTEYTSKGFLITPEEYWDQYETMGVIRIQYDPSFTQVYRGGPDWDKEFTDSKVYSNPVKEEYWRVSKPNTDRIIEEAYDIAIGLGADAITAFDISRVNYINGPVVVDTYVLTGFAIKRNP